ncbi:MAG: hypothetical protein GC203_01215 [Phenylobacterium sp.]|uniref:hypothetical protein n=1 Tax=Phenylobacterium sp. TaxID=1871053 RepID=UPI0025D5765B|nr:hypothetical protein [Phenylobacterium sp.]MBI1196463.1 hypothetical protein [Phenylobacterium sp.]
MRRALILLLGAAIAAATLGPAAQAAPAGADSSVPPPGWKRPHNAWGQPDLSGNWTNATMTPLTRNKRLSDKTTLSKDEAQELETAWTTALANANKPTDPNSDGEDFQKDPAYKKLLEFRPDFGAAGGDVGGYNVFWIDPGTHILEINGEYRTSILTTPNGQFPPRKKTAPPMDYSRYRPDYTSYETLSLGERCIMGFGRNAGPPMITNGYYNNGYKIIQTPDQVVIEVELIHDARIIRLNSKHRTDGVRPWMGDSIGWYDGDTLVVETTNLPEAQDFMGSWKNLKVTEWFTRLSPTRILYRFQVEDPDTWDQPWGGEYTFAPYGQIYEYACHEGNYALPGILAGAREEEKKAAAEAAGGAAKPGGQ